VGDTNYPESVFRRWSKQELLTLGIKPFRENAVDRKYYLSTGTTDTDVDGDIVRSHTTTQRYTGQELKERFGKKMKRHLMGQWRDAQEEHEYLLMFEPTNQTDIDLWVQYKADLRSSAQTIKTAFQQLTSYEDGIEFIRSYANLLPDTPSPLSEDEE
jgi:hypothetical protein